MDRLSEAVGTDMETTPYDAGPVFDRRDAIKFGAGLIFLGVEALNPSVASAKNPTVERLKAGRVSAADALKTLQANRNGLLTLEYDPEKDGEGILCRSIDRPTDWTLTPVCVSKVINNVNGNPTVMLPCFRDIGDQGHIATSVSVLAGGKPLTEGWSSSIIYSKSGEKNHHKNAFTLTQIPKLETKQMEVRQVSWMMLPVHPAMPNGMGPKLLGKMTAKEVQTFAQRANVEPFKHWYDPSGSKAVDTVVKESAALKDPAKIVEFAVRKGCAIQWDGGLSTSDPGQVLAKGKGDCLTKATMAAIASGGYITIAEGYRLQPDMMKSAGGRHVYNVGIANGLFVVDPLGKNNYYFGPQTSEFLIAALGGWHDIPDAPCKIRPDGGMNGGYWSGAQGTGEMALISTPKIGVRAKELAAMKPPKEVLAYYEARKEIRKVVSGAAR